MHARSPGFAEVVASVQSTPGAVGHVSGGASVAGVKPIAVAP
jgi:hypothetical protein